MHYSGSWDEPRGGGPGAARWEGRKVRRRNKCDARAGSTPHRSGPRHRRPARLVALGFTAQFTVRPVPIWFMNVDCLVAVKLVTQKSRMRIGCLQNGSSTLSGQFGRVAQKVSQSYWLPAIDVHWKLSPKRNGSRSRFLQSVQAFMGIPSILPQRLRLLRQMIS